MEGNLSQGGMHPGGASFGGIDLQGSGRVHHHTNMHQSHHHTPRQGSSIHEGFPLTMGTMQSGDQNMLMADYNKGERGKSSMSDDDEPSFNEEGAEGNTDNKGKKGSPWQRVKWTDKMVKLLITAVSYMGEDTAVECSGGVRRKFAALQKKGKWKSVSKVMAERGFAVSPQQCEDKFNDLNKRYKKLNDMLGRGTSCEVVENPKLLDYMDLSEKEKDDVKKILSSKHLFYEEMCSYHNGNRLHLPHDPALQRSLQLALRTRDDHDNDDGRRHQNDDCDENDHDAETDEHDEFEENHHSHGDNKGMHGVLGSSVKRMRPGQVHDDVCYPSSLPSHGCSKSSHPCPPEMPQGVPENARAAWLHTEWFESRSFQLHQQRLQIEVETLELKKEQLRWKRFSKKRDAELEEMRMENEKMRLENDRMALELKEKELKLERERLGLGADRG